MTARPQHPPLPAARAQQLRRTICDPSPAGPPPQLLLAAMPLL
eukprot:COSAG04_NODE_12521_length_648_cov_1.726776_1_plen_42_part_10